MALAAADALGAIVAAHAADSSCSHRLAVDNPGARLRVTANTRAELLTEHVVQMLPRAVQTPQSKVVVGGLPGRKLVRQQPPGAATSHDVEDGVQDLAQRMKPWSADTRARRQERIQAGELRVRQIGKVGSPRGDIPAILPAKPAESPVFGQFLVLLRWVVIEGGDKRVATDHQRLRSAGPHQRKRLYWRSGRGPRAFGAIVSGCAQTGWRAPGSKGAPHGAHPGDVLRCR